MMGSAMIYYLPWVSSQSIGQEQARSFQYEWIMLPIASLLVHTLLWARMDVEGYAGAILAVVDNAGDTEGFRGIMDAVVGWDAEVTEEVVGGFSNTDEPMVGSLVTGSCMDFGVMCKVANWVRSIGLDVLSYILDHSIFSLTSLPPIAQSS